jgi:transcriptional regulator with XRE-family HTH domain
MFSVENKFANWVNHELEIRGWNQSTLTKKSGLAHGTISNILSGTRGIGEETCLALAKAFKLPPETVFRAAGLLPPKKDIDPEIERAMHLASQLSEEELQEVIKIVELKLDRQEREKENAAEIRYSRTIQQLHVAADKKKS